MPEAGRIPMLDLVSPHRELEPELMSVFQSSLRTAGFVGGPTVQRFENEFAEFCGVRHAVALASGTDAVRFALIAAGVQPGDVVITVPNTFIATVEAISQAGALAEFVDIDERTYCMDPQKLAEYFDRECYIDGQTNKAYHRRYRAPVTAVVPVHLYGQVANMDPIFKLARRFSVMVVEDACQAHGAQYHSESENRWRSAGSMGAAAAFSFYPGKNLGACGEGGAATTNDESIAKRMRMLRDHGQSKKYYHDIEGYNGRLDAIQAGILSVKLRRLQEWNEKRRQAADRYDRMFSGIDGVVTPHTPEWSKPVYHLYVIRVQDRPGLQKHLSEHQIDTGIHYPVPLHLQKAYANRAFRTGDFPVTEKVAAEIVSLPMYPELTEAQQARVVECVAEFVAPQKNQSGAEMSIASRA